MAGRDVPGRRSYGSFAQIENGVGLVRRFRDEAASLFRRKRWPGGAAGGTVVTGRSAARLVAGFLEEFSSRAGARFVAVPVVNHLMGDSVTVTGLLGGNDIAEAVRGRRPRDALHPLRHPPGRGRPVPRRALPFGAVAADRCAGHPLRADAEGVPRRRLPTEPAGISLTFPSAVGKFMDPDRRDGRLAQMVRVPA